MAPPAVTGVLILTLLQYTTVRVPGALKYRTHAPNRNCGRTNITNFVCSGVINCHANNPVYFLYKYTASRASVKHQMTSPNDMEFANHTFTNFVCSGVINVASVRACVRACVRKQSRTVAEVLLVLVRVLVVRVYASIRPGGYGTMTVRAVLYSRMYNRSVAAAARLQYEYGYWRPRGPRLHVPYDIAQVTVRGILVQYSYGTRTMIKMYVRSYAPAAAHLMPEGPRAVRYRADTYERIVRYDKDL